ncbi:hypothetical protein EB093_02080 [bacterium]|nr:hypothetical protein [bacterium]
MNVSGEFSSAPRGPKAPAPSATDPSQFTQALRHATTQVQSVVPAAQHAGQMSLAKKKEKKNLDRVAEVEALAAENGDETIDQIVAKIASHIRTLSHYEQQNLGL